MEQPIYRTPLLLQSVATLREKTTNCSVLALPGFLEYMVELRSLARQVSGGVWLGLLHKIARQSYSISLCTYGPLRGSAPSKTEGAYHVQCVGGTLGDGTAREILGSGTAERGDRQGVFLGHGGPAARNPFFAQWPPPEVFPAALKSLEVPSLGGPATQDILAVPSLGGPAAQNRWRSPRSAVPLPKNAPAVPSRGGPLANYRAAR